MRSRREVEWPWRKGEGDRTEALPPEGKHERGATQRRGPTKGQHRREALLQGSPNEGKLEPDWLPQEASRKDVPSAWEEAAPWDPGRRPPREHIVDSKRPIEAMGIAAGIVAHKKNPGHVKSRVSQAPPS